MPLVTTSFHVIWLLPGHTSSSLHGGFLVFQRASATVANHTSLPPAVIVTRSTPCFASAAASDPTCAGSFHWPPRSIVSIVASLHAQKPEGMSRYSFLPRTG